jgi:hypothetical protein
MDLMNLVADYEFSPLRTRVDDVYAQLLASCESLAKSFA